MSHRTYLIADLHLGHEGTAHKFLREDGTPLRPFKDAKEQDQTIVERWNEIVRPVDKVYVLGDVAMHNRDLATVYKLKGDKVLIKGNHDQEKLSRYATCFRDVRACHQLAGFLLTHIPIHPDSLSRWTGNFHGHLHHRRVMKDIIAREEGPHFESVIDPRYFCVSVEHLDYRPILLEEAIARFEKENALAAIGLPDSSNSQGQTVTSTEGVICEQT